MLAAALFVLLAGCTESKPWALRDISGLLPDLDFQLTRASDGRTVTEADYAGKVTVLFFGYTSCPDICPMTLAKFSQALQSMGPAADAVRVLFVSVDPERDTLEDLRRYVNAFGKRIVGLRGSLPVLRELTKRYRVTFGYGEPNEQGWYKVSHSSAAYIFDREGDIRLLAGLDDSIDAIASGLKRLVQE